MLDHALGHHGADPHAGAAGPQDHNALLRQAVSWLTLNLEGAIHPCKGCCSCALQVQANPEGFKLFLVNLNINGDPGSQPRY